MGLGSHILPPLVDYFGSAQAVWQAPQQALLEAMQARGLASPTKRGLEKFQQLRSHGPHQPETLAAYCETHAVTVCCWADENYPELLRYIARPPMVLYIRGTLPRMERPLAMVGSRRASVYGLQAARAFGADVARHGVTVVSGGALGIDAASHEGALEGGGLTVSVMGCGIDQLYPPQNRKLLERVTLHGAVISEYPPGTPGLPGNFPARNRIIAGLTRGVLVVEAAKTSGAMITVDEALNEGREVFCVPGNIFLPTSVGTHSLIKRGAHLVDRVEDILEELWPELPPKNGSANLFMGGDNAATAAAGEALLASLSPRQRELMELLGKPQTLDALSEATQQPPQVLQAELLDLQLQGLVALADGVQYFRVH